MKLWAFCAVTIVLLAILSIMTLPHSVAGANRLTSEEWREDLRTLAEQLPERHANAFHTITPERLETAISVLDKRIPNLADHQIIVELAGIVALIGDGHTRLTLPLGHHTGFGRTHSRTEPPNADAFHTLPVEFSIFSDGLFIWRITVDEAWAVGSRILEIGKVEAEVAMEAVSSIAHRDNDMQVMTLIPHFLAVPEVLHAKGLIDDMNRVRFRVEKPDGEKADLWLEPMDSASNAEYIDMRDASSPPPLYLKDPQNPFWFEYLEDSGAFYVQYNAVSNKEDETTEEFFGRVFAAAEEHSVEKFILDIRLNGGGNNFLNRPLIHGLICAHNLNQPGRLFTIIGRQTFSAAQNAATHLDLHTHTLFVGEPTGGKPNHYGDSRKFTLPNSGLTVRASTLYWQDSVPWDDRPWIPPDIAVKVSSDDYRSNRDPVLEAILGYTLQPSLKERIKESFASGDGPRAVEIYEEFWSDPRNAYRDIEVEMNTFGYELLQAEQVEDALTVFKLIVESYPTSWNAYDSLGEAFLYKGERSSAIENYEKSLKLNPNNGNAVEMLEKLGVR
jgi:tetratricopeptide (TPR) repeat protein